jgi:SAM-dependent methyltransferase
MPPDDASMGYEEHAAEFMRQRDARIGLEIVRAWAAELPRDAAVLELGCGHGVVSQVLADAGCSLYAVDASPSLLEAFRRRFPTAQMECAAAEASRYFDRTFDGVVAVGLIFLLPAAAQRRVLRRAARVLREGGRLLFTAPRQRCVWTDVLTGQESRSLGRAEYRRILRAAGVTLQRECSDEGENHYYFGCKDDPASPLA